MAMTTTQAVTILFGAYGENKNVDRMQIYCTVLKDVSPALLESAVYKVLGEWEKTFLPPPAVILNAAKSLVESKNPDTKIKSWAEALNEIEKKMYSTQAYKRPEWSTPEIAMAVNAIGWENLIMTLSEDMPTVRAQMRKLYEDACKLATESARNDYLLGKNPLGVIGIRKREAVGLESAADVIKEITQ